jgi:hypothetical protein
MTILASARQPPIQLSEQAAGGANDDKRDDTAPLTSSIHVDISHGTAIEGALRGSVNAAFCNLPKAAGPIC